MCAIYLITKKCRLLCTVHNDDYTQSTVQTLHQRSLLLQPRVQFVDVSMETTEANFGGKIYLTFAMSF